MSGKSGGRTGGRRTRKERVLCLPSEGTWDLLSVILPRHLGDGVSVSWWVS